MIKGIYVIYNNGICLYKKSWLNIPNSEQLIAGFSTALDRFCKTSIGENISFLCTTTLKLHFIRKHDLIFVVLTDKTDVLEKLRPKLEQIIINFDKEFSKQRQIFEKQGLIPNLTKFDMGISQLSV